MDPAYEEPDVDAVHVVLLGDSTLDNGRHLNLDLGELSVERQLLKRCRERRWSMTNLAQDGSLLEDVRERQLRGIPESATHLVLSISGNDLLALLNEMVLADFSLKSMYAAIVEGMKKVAQDYERLMRDLKACGCHLACCTVYQPNFSHVFFRSLAKFALGLHNSRIHQISQDLDCSVIDLASIVDGPQDFANPLELNTLGGAKVVENVSDFVSENPTMTMQRLRQSPALPHDDDDALLKMAAGDTVFGCCTTRATRRRVFVSTDVKGLELPDPKLAGGPLPLALDFSQEQQRWRTS